MQVRWTTPAAQDLEEITLYIQKDSGLAAEAVAKALFDSANSLELLPSRGRMGRIPGRRELVVPGLPYIIVYRIDEAAIQIVHIYHARRQRLAREAAVAKSGDMPHRTQEDFTVIVKFEGKEEG